MYDALMKYEQKIIDEMSRTKLLSWKRVKLAIQLTGVCAALTR